MKGQANHRNMSRCGRNKDSVNLNVALKAQGKALSVLGLCMKGVFRGVSCHFWPVSPSSCSPHLRLSGKSHLFSQESLFLRKFSPEFVCLFFFTFTANLSNTSGLSSVMLHLINKSRSRCLNSKSFSLFSFWLFSETTWLIPWRGSFFLLAWYY